MTTLLSAKLVQVGVTVGRDWRRARSTRVGGRGIEGCMVLRTLTLQYLCLYTVHVVIETEREVCEVARMIHTPMMILHLDGVR